MIPYLIEAGLVHLSLYLIYLLLLKKETHYQFRRVYLVAISLVVVGTMAISKYRYPRCDDDEAKAFIEEVVSNSTRTYTLIFVT